MTTTREKRPARSGAEWVTFAVSLIILSAVVALVASQLLGSEAPPEPRAEQKGAIREAGGQFYVPVEVRNHGDETAENVQVVAELVIDGEAAEADQAIDFLAGGESEALEFVFDDDPKDGELTVQVSGFLVP